MPAGRRRRIQEIVSERDLVSTDELAALVGASPVTIRRDLAELEGLGALERTRGGARLSRHTLAVEEVFAARERKHADEKRQIGEQTAELIRDADSVWLNDGSTVMQVARNLIRADREMMVATNALNVALALLEGPRIEVTVIGGLLRLTSFGTFWPNDNLMGSLQLDAAVLGVASLDPRAGVAMHHYFDVAVAERMMSRARRVIVVADSSKWGEQGRAHLAGWREIDALVTDGCPDGAAHLLGQHGVEVVIASA